MDAFGNASLKARRNRRRVSYPLCALSYLRRLARTVGDERLCLETTDFVKPPRNLRDVLYCSSILLAHLNTNRFTLFRPN